jgi:hypothetical protein
MDRIEALNVYNNTSVDRPRRALSLDNWERLTNMVSAYRRNGSADLDSDSKSDFDADQEEEVDLIVGTSDHQRVEMNLGPHKNR